MMTKSDKILTAGWVGLAAGVWLMLSAFFVGPSFMSGLFLVGALVTLFSIIEISSVESSAWVSWMNGILGVWLIVSPFIFATIGVKALWNSVILGVILVGISVWAGMTSSIMGHSHPKMS